MASTVATKRSTVPSATNGVPHAMPIPTTPAAGMSAAATITPMSDSGPFVVTPNVAAAPAAMPTRMATELGARRRLTSSMLAGASVDVTIESSFIAKAVTVAPTIATARPSTCWRTPATAISQLFVVAPTVAVSIGPMMGAMTIDPTTMAGESMSNPAVAMIALRKSIQT